MLDILLEDFNIDYAEIIEQDMKTLERLYLIDFSGEKIKVNINDNSAENIEEIFEKSIHITTSILNKGKSVPKISTPFSENNLINFLVLENLLLLEKAKRNEYVGFSKFMGSSDVGYDEQGIYKKVKAILLYSPFKELFGIQENNNRLKDNRIKYIAKSFLIPIVSRIIQNCENEPYINFFIERQRRTNNDFCITFDEKDSLIPLDSPEKQLNKIKKFFSIMFSEVAKKDKDSLNFFSLHTASTQKQTEEIRLLELLCYYVLDEVYNLSNYIFLSKQLASHDFLIDKSFLIKLLAKTVLISECFDKNTYTENILNCFVTSKRSLESCISDNESIKTLNDLNDQYNFFNKQINFFSFVFLPLLSKCFNVIYYLSHKDLPETSFGKDLKEYVMNNNLLSKYEQKTNTCLSELNNLSEEEKTILLDFLRNAEYSVFNKEAIKFLRPMISIDYLASDFPYARTAVEAILEEKINGSIDAMENYFDNLRRSSNT